MASSKELTGGTGDVNPQILTVEISQTTLNQSISLEVPLPIPRTPSTTSGRTTVIEILWATSGMEQLVTTATQRIESTVSTSPNATDVSTNQVFAYLFVEQDTADATGFNRHIMPVNYQLNDGAGHGYLVGTDSLTFSLGSVASQQLNTVVWKLYFRFKTVSLQEYIGMVQGQQ